MRTHPIRHAALALAGLAALAAPLAAPASAAPDAPKIVTYQNGVYSPAAFTMCQGTLIVFKNSDAVGVQHSLTVTLGTVDSLPVIAPAAAPVAGSVTLMPRPTAYAFSDVWGGSSASGSVTVKTC